MEPKLQQQHLIVQADILYHSDKIQDPVLDREIGTVLEKAHWQSLSQYDIEVLEKAVKAVQTGK